jgi:hypothetical protein
MAAIKTSPKPTKVATASSASPGLWDAWLDA